MATKTPKSKSGKKVAAKASTKKTVKAKALTIDQDIQIWATYRRTISNLDRTVVTLLTQATLLSSAVLGAVYGANLDGQQQLYIMMAIIVALAFLALRIFSYVQALNTTMENAKKLEAGFLDKPASNPRALTHQLTGGQSICGLPSALLSYVLWSFALIIFVFCFAVFLGLG